MNTWIVIGVLAAIVVMIPIAAIILVSFASLSEEAAHSLGRPAPGFAERMARRLLGYHVARSGQPGRPVRTARRAAPVMVTEVRFDHARRTLPDSREYPASSQPGSSAVRPRERAGAGV